MILVSIVCSNIRDCADGLNIEDNYFIGCLYPDKFRSLAIETFFGVLCFAR